MPTYEFHCWACAVSIDVNQCHKKILCPHCKAPMERIFSPVPAIFKSGGTGARRNG